MQLCLVLFVFGAAAQGIQQQLQQLLCRGLLRLPPLPSCATPMDASGGVPPNAAIGCWHGRTRRQGVRLLLLLLLGGYLQLEEVLQLPPGCQELRLQRASRALPPPAGPGALQGQCCCQALAGWLQRACGRPPQGGTNKQVAIECAPSACCARAE